MSCPYNYNWHGLYYFTDIVPQTIPLHVYSQCFACMQMPPHSAVPLMILINLEDLPCRWPWGECIKLCVHVFDVQCYQLMWFVQHGCMQLYNVVYNLHSATKVMIEETLKSHTVLIIMYSRLSLIRSPLGPCSLAGIARWLQLRK